MSRKKKKKTEEEKKKRAKIELVIFLAFIAFVFAYSKILIIRNHNSISKENYIYKIDISKLNKYDFDIDIKIDDKSYNYFGTIDNDNGNINKYRIINGQIYNENLEKVDNIFYGIDNRYFKLNTIASYLDEENYKNNQYEIYSNDIINAKLENFIIYADVKYNKDNIIIKLDYSNLARLINNDTNKYIVTYTITNYK